LLAPLALRFGGNVAGADRAAETGPRSPPSSPSRDGRIDDPDAGWKGREIWTTYGSRTNFHLEGG